MTKTKKIIDALTNGGENTPYWRWNRNHDAIEVLVADDQLMCTIPPFDNAEDLAEAICESGNLWKNRLM